MTEIVETLRVRAPRERVYALWSDPETFVTIVDSLNAAERDGTSLRWQASGPLGIPLKGEAELTQQREPERLAWNTLEGALDAHGSIDLTSDGDATVVRYTIRYEVPGGRAGEVIADEASVREQLCRTLERFRELAENGGGSD